MKYEFCIVLRYNKFIIINILLVENFGVIDAVKTVVGVLLVIVCSVLVFTSTICITPPAPPEGTPSTGIILSTLNSDDMIYEGSVGQVTEERSKS